MVTAPLTLLLFACVDGPGGVAMESTADLDVFTEDVQPVLASTCANGTCHGDADRPLEIYAVHHHRLDPGDVYLDTGLTDEELRLNWLRASAFIEEVRGWPDVRAEECSLLLKPMAEEIGGAVHGGGDVFFDPWDRDFVALRDWIDDALEAQ